MPVDSRPRGICAPLFSNALDKDPRVQSWLSSLGPRDRRALFDPITPAIKESASGNAADDRVSNDDADRAPTGLDDETRQKLRAVFLAAAKSTLPEWQARIFRRWVAGMNPTHVAQELKLSRSTVRAALQGQPHKGVDGAVQTVADAVAADDDQREAVVEILADDAPSARSRLASWFRNLDAKPGLAEPLAMLLVVEALADKKREVLVAELMQHWPRSRITPNLALLKGCAYATCDGRVIRVLRTPVDDEAKR